VISTSRWMNLFAKQEQMAKAYALAREHLRVAAERRKASYDVRVYDVHFSVGQWVWYWCPRRYPSKSPKWQQSYIGPYLIVRKIEQVNVVLQHSPKAKPFVVHVNKIKLCEGVTSDSSLVSTRIPAPSAAPDSVLEPRSRRTPHHLAGYYCCIVDAFDDVCSFLEYV